MNLRKQEQLISLLIVKGCGITRSITSRAHINIFEKPIRWYRFSSISF